MMSQETPWLPRIVDFSLDHLRAGLDRDTFECHLTRQGNLGHRHRRLAAVPLQAHRHGTRPLHHGLTVRGPPRPLKSTLPPPSCAVPMSEKVTPDNNRHRKENLAS